MRFGFQAPSIKIIRALLLVCACAFVAAAADWTEWRGPHRDGVLITEPKAWPEKLNLKWKIEVGEGHSSPILVGDSIYDFARLNDQETVFAIDPSNGAIRWKQQYPAPYKVISAAQGHGPGPKSTPLYSNGKLYTLGLSGILSCWDAKTGKLDWRKDSSQEFKAGAPVFGAAMSPIADRGMVIAHIGGDHAGALKAFDASTGSVKWTWTEDGPAYASPIIVELAGARQVVTQSQLNIIGVDEATGKTLWKIPFTTNYEQNIVTPVLYKDTLIFSGLDKGVFAVRLTRNGGGITPQTVWENKDASMYMNSPVLSGDVLFGFSHLKKGQLFAMDAATGKALWMGPPRAGDNAAVLAGASTLISLNNEGQLTIARADGKSFQVIRQYNVAGSATWAHPLVLSDGVLIKDVKSLARWGI
jgi:outer membrane protein assembly factor BamB